MRNYFRFIKIKGIWLFLLLAFYQCNHKMKESKDTNTNIIMDLSSVSVQLPEGKGAHLVQANCLTCHSLKYIEMQPKLSHEAWLKVVNKMVKSYGSPIKDTAAIDQLVDYLCSIKGI